MRPAYMTMMRDVRVATTPRSWVTRMTDIFICSFSSSRRFKICAWIVTSRPVVGSSAISSFGEPGEGGRDDDALAHAARQLARIGAVALDGRGDAHEIEQLDRASLRRGAVHAEAHPQDLVDLLADAHDGVERGHRVLEDHGDFEAPDGALLLLARAHDFKAVETH